METLSNAIHTRFTSAGEHFSPSVFEQIHEIQQREQLTIHWSTETRSNQSSESSTCYCIMSFISLEQAIS